MDPLVGCALRGGENTGDQRPATGPDGGRHRDRRAPGREPRRPAGSGGAGPRRPGHRPPDRGGAAEPGRLEWRRTPGAGGAERADGAAPTARRAARQATGGARPGLRPRRHRPALRPRRPPGRAGRSRRATRGDRGPRARHRRRHRHAGHGDARGDGSAQPDDEQLGRRPGHLARGLRHRGAADRPGRAGLGGDEGKARHAAGGTAPAGRRGPAAGGLSGPGRPALGAPAAMAPGPGDR